jgi:RNA polymerase sigma-70 factor, ECF subfamily
MTNGSTTRIAVMDLQALFETYHAALFQYALGLTRSESEARDLTQQTFYLLAAKGHQVRDLSKIKSWLFTTLHRVFLQLCRKQTRFPHYELSAVNSQLPAVQPREVSSLDVAGVLRALNQIEPVYRAPVALFYLEDQPYREIARTLEVPIGTVKSRISRGIAQLKQILGTTQPHRN